MILHTYILYTVRDKGATCILLSAVRASVSVWSHTGRVCRTGGLQLNADPRGIGSGIPGTVEERVFQGWERTVEAGVARRGKFTVLPFAAGGRQLFFISSKNLT